MNCSNCNVERVSKRRTFEISRIFGRPVKNLIFVGTDNYIDDERIAQKFVPTGAHVIN